MAPSFRPRIQLLVGVILLRLALACGDSYDQAGDPRFAPFPVTHAGLETTTRASDGQADVAFYIVAEMHQKTYRCTIDGTACSRSGSDDPDEECFGHPPDFGPHWGERALDQLTIREVTVEACRTGIDCTIIPASFVHVAEDPAYRSYDERSTWHYRSSFTARVPIETLASGTCPRIRAVITHVDGHDETITFNLESRCMPVAPTPAGDAGADASGAMDGSPDAEPRDAASDG